MTDTRAILRLLSPSELLLWHALGGSVKAMAGKKSYPRREFG